MRSKAKGLGMFLRERRLLCGITQLEAGKYLGHSTAMYISNYERSLCEPSVEMTLKLCKLFRIPKSQIKRVMVELYEQELAKKMKAAS